MRHDIEEVATGDSGVEIVCACGVVAVATMMNDESFRVQCFVDDKPAPEQAAVHGAWALVAYRHLEVALNRILAELTEQQQSMTADWALAYMESQT